MDHSTGAVAEVETAVSLPFQRPIIGRLRLQPYDVMALSSAGAASPSCIAMRASSDPCPAACASIHL